MTETRAERRLAAILAADVAGYSRLVEADETGTLSALKARRKSILEPLLGTYRGRIVKVMGDGVLVEFASPVNAVTCAVELQKRMALANNGIQDDRRIVLRIGINLGDVVVEGGDLYGDGVNVAARLESLSEAGGLCISAGVFDLVRGKVPYAFTALGPQRLKNIQRPVEVYRLTVAQLPKQPGRAADPRLSDKPAIAVLPFESIGRDAIAARLADGLTEDIITDLARFRGLDVIARNSAAVYKGRFVDVRQVGRELSVHYVLEGSIQRQVGKIRITAQLIDSSGGTTLWSERWDRPDKDIFAIQTEVATQVAVTLGGMGGSAVITSEEIRKARRREPENLTAYDYYLQANEARRLFTRESVPRGIELATKAIALDPTLSRAYLARAWLNYILVHYGAASASAMEKMEADVRQALALDPFDAEARSTLAFYLSSRGRFQESENQIQAALQANPASAQVLVVAAAMHAYNGKPTEAAELADKVMRLDPWMTAENLNCVKDAYFFARRFEDVVAVVSRIPEDARGRGAWLLLTLSCAMLGRESEAAQAKAELLAKYPSISAERLMSEEWRFARAEEENLFLNGFRKARLPLRL
jgi:TolB-like protein/Tfp pilus assembly protein PilF